VIISANSVTPSASENFTLGLGIFGFLPLAGAISVLNNGTAGFEDVTAILMIFLHLITILIALPFLLKSTGQDHVDPIFRIGIQILSLLNALSMIVIIFSLPNPTPVAYTVFGIITLVELTPVALIRFRYQPKEKDYLS
jgi:hypothetical protein